jgi:Putative amidase domain
MGVPSAIHGRATVTIRIRPLYDRLGALTYALYYWNKVCHDGRIATNSDPRDPSHANDPAAYGQARRGAIINDPLNPIPLPPHTVEEDCTHFISCCVGFKGTLPSSADGKPLAAGGGLAIYQTYPPYNNPFGMDNVPALLDDLEKKGFAQVVSAFLPMDAKNVVATAAKMLANRPRPGDLLAYSKSNSKAGYIHFAMIVGSRQIAFSGSVFLAPTIACHTHSRFDKEFTDVGWPFVSLVKIIVPDSRPP